LPISTDPTDRPSVSIETHGCKLNQADSSRLAWRFAQAGFHLVPADGPADIHVLNTCTVTHIADRKARQALRAIRRRSPYATIVATGCYSQRDPRALEALEEIDLVIGNTGKDDLVQQVVDWRGTTAVPCATGAVDDAFSPHIARTRAMVKIQEGCDQVCSYCIVPKVRGRERSISPEEIVDDINRFTSYGYQEVVLTGTQLGSYGFELEGIDLAGLLKTVLAGTGVPRIRVSSLQPQELGCESLDLWRNSRLCPHFHVPLQSGSDLVLRRMLRRYTAAQYLEAVETVRQCVPDVSITSDVMVGFPGETDAEFEETHALCKQVGFAHIHVFPFSVRPGTSTAHLEGQVEPGIKAGRAQRLLALSESQSTRFRKQFLDTVRPVLWEGRGDADDSSLWSGLTDNYIRVLADSSSELTGRLTSAKLVSLHNDAVLAEVL